MKTIIQTYEIQAPIEKVWEALTTAASAEKWGAGQAKVEPVMGGEFSYWDGDIHGKFTNIIPGKVIEQDWYGHDNPSWKYTIKFEFEEHDNVTTVKMTYSGEVVDEQRDIGHWKEYYFDPITKLLEA